MSTRCDVLRCTEEYSVITEDGERYCGTHFREYVTDDVEYQVIDTED